MCCNIRYVFSLTAKIKMAGFLIFRGAEGWRRWLRCVGSGALRKVDIIDVMSSGVREGFWRDTCYRMFFKNDCRYHDKKPRVIMAPLSAVPNGATLRNVERPEY